MEIVSTILTSVCTDNSETTSSAWRPPKRGFQSREMDGGNAHKERSIRGVGSNGLQSNP